MKRLFSGRYRVIATTVDDHPACLPLYLYLRPCSSIARAVKYSEMEDMEDESCAICLVDYEAEDDLRNLPCGHSFHKTCVDGWLAVNASCPNCRARCFDTEDDEGEEKTPEPLPAGENLA